MSTTTTPIPPPQQLDGYSLVEQIGTGAYGEVWKADAPGGLTKAIKYVYGQLDGKRATSEFKALERVRQVRHPFLLSLERIEVVDGRLIVVTELADASLRDRFAECVRENGRGIPREELLRHLSEAAEALDYLSQQHDLQHLDVKPENLLLLAGHVKVADFGLVKSMSDQQQSVVGGMTPMYAAPEVFQGTPSSRSDQYSLAVMYQELLTGVLPFSGETTAELTMQHLRDEPNLEPLSEADRFVISRALSKSSEHRYESCVELAQALAGVQTTPYAAEAAPLPSQRETTRVTSTPTEIFSDEEAGNSNHGSILLDVSAVDPTAVQVASPLQVEYDGFEPGPALLVGLGGIGGEVLTRLKGKLVARREEESFPNQLPMLLLDTDPKSIQAATREQRGGGLTAEETLLLSLRRPQDYRAKASSMLRWLSRRWLYNVPRSLRTEGIRPLGRLALLDHARQAMQRLRGVVSAAIAATDATSDRPLRVYVVSSINGGTGGAMTTDIAFSLRTILERMGVTNATIHGLMLNASVRGPQQGELARVNAFAWFSEFQHFNRPQVAYPGDTGSGLPAHDHTTPLFDHAYLLELGDGIDANQLAAGVDSAAEYLLQDALTPTQAALDACRAASSGRPGELRTAQLHRYQSAPESQRLAAISALTRELGLLWCDDLSVGRTHIELTTSTNHLVRGAATLVNRLKLDSLGLTTLCRQAVERSWSPASTDAMGAVPFNQIAAALSGDLAQQLSLDIATRLIDANERLSGAEGAAFWYLQHLQSVDSELQSLLAQVRSDAGLDDAQQLADKHRTHLAALQLARMVADQLKTHLITARKSISQLAVAFKATTKTTPEQQEQPWHDLPEQQRSEMLVEADQLLRQELTQHAPALLKISAEQDLTEPIAHLVEQQVSGVVDRALSGVITSNAGGQSPADVCPPLAQYGRELQRVLVAPSQVAPSGPLAEIENVTLAPSNTAASCLIIEAGRLSVPHVASHLVRGRRDYAQLASRVLTRQDIEWTSPLDLAAVDTPATPPASVPQQSLVMTDTLTPTCLLPS